MSSAWDDEYSGSRWFFSLWLTFPAFICFDSLVELSSSTPVHQTSLVDGLTALLLVSSSSFIKCIDLKFRCLLQHLKHPLQFSKCSLSRVILILNDKCKNIRRIISKYFTMKSLIKESLPSKHIEKPRSNQKYPKGLLMSMVLLSVTCQVSHASHSSASLLATSFILSSSIPKASPSCLVGLEDDPDDPIMCLDRYSNDTIGIRVLVPRSTQYLHCYQRIVAGIDLALREVRRLGLLQEWEFDVKYRNTRCSEAYGQTWSLRSFMAEKTHLLLGPVSKSKFIIQISICEVEMY